MKSGNKQSSCLPNLGPCQQFSVLLVGVLMHSLPYPYIVKKTTSLDLCWNLGLLLHEPWYSEISAVKLQICCLFVESVVLGFWILD
jgi:hypothetical protein